MGLEVPLPLPDLFPLVVQYADGEMMCCDEGHWAECTKEEDLDEFLKWVAVIIRDSDQTRIRIFKKPEGINCVHADTPVRLCYVGELLDDDTIQWTSHRPNMRQ